MGAFLPVFNQYLLESNLHLHSLLLSGIKEPLTLSNLPLQASEMRDSLFVV